MSRGGARAGAGRPKGSRGGGRPASPLGETVRRLAELGRTAGEIAAMPWADLVRAARELDPGNAPAAAAALGGIPGFRSRQAVERVLATARRRLEEGRRRGLDGSGLEPHRCSFRIAPLGPGRPGFTLESRQLTYLVYATPAWPLVPAEFALGAFRCVGCVVRAGIVEWGPLGCPVHTPGQSWPVRDALTVRHLRGDLPKAR